MYRCREREREKHICCMNRMLHDLIIRQHTQQHKLFDKRRAPSTRLITITTKPITHTNNNNNNNNTNNNNHSNNVNHND